MVKKRFFPLFLLIALFLAASLLFSACGGQETTTAPGSSSTTPASSSKGEMTTPESTPSESSAPATSEKTPVTEDPWVSAIFGGGPFVNGGIAVANKIKNTSFNTMLIWSVHVHENGDLYLNDIPVCKDGELVNKSISRTWDFFHALCPNITRYEISIGGWGCTDFENIRTLIKRDGTGSDTVLYRNFAALLEATGATAVNFDDESCYDVSYMTQFGQMCVAMGAKVTLCPYTNQSFWVNLYKAIGPEHIDRIYLQCYAGGAGNTPSDWARAFGTDVIPGYWCLHGSEGMTADQVAVTLKRQIGVSEGGFLWLYDDMQGLASPNTVADYADALVEAGKLKKWD